jgi:hypothetical protein
MDNNALEKLKKNPHYKMSQKQKQATREEMVEFGKVPLHNQQIQKHPTGTARVAREKQTVLE